MQMREKLEAAWESAYWAHAISIVYRPRFTRFLDAEAWLDAAMMLVPQGWTGLIPVRGGRDEEAWLWPKDGTMNKGYRCAADTPAEALLAAIEKART